MYICTVITVLLILNAMDLNKLYQQIMGGSQSDTDSRKDSKEYGFYSLYDKSDYETRTYSSFNNISI